MEPSPGFTRLVSRGDEPGGRRPFTIAHPDHVRLLPGLLVEAREDASHDAGLVAAAAEREAQEGEEMRFAPLSNSRSLSNVSRALRIALLALKISSRKAIDAVGR